jgi:hypothetical protein
VGVRNRTLATVALLAALMMVTSVAPVSAGEEADLGALRAATAKYHDLDVAIADGYALYEPLARCISHPTDGAMGWHYFNMELMADPESDPLQPDALVYRELPNGKLVLDAVEWVVPSEVWATTGNSDPPSVYGRDLGILNPALGWYIIHAWIWYPNPAGMWENWNPKVSCD